MFSLYHTKRSEAIVSTWKTPPVLILGRRDLKTALGPMTERAACLLNMETYSIWASSFLCGPLHHGGYWKEFVLRYALAPAVGLLTRDTEDRLHILMRRRSTNFTPQITFLKRGSGNRVIWLSSVFMTVAGLFALNCVLSCVLWSLPVIAKRDVSVKESVCARI